MIKAVIFDMDGILFDTERVAVRSWDKAGHELGVENMGQIVPFVLGCNQEASWQVVRTYTGDDFDYDKFRVLVRDYSRDYLRRYGVPVKDGVRIALQYLKENGYLTAVATSTSKESATSHFIATGLMEYFDEFVFGDEVKNSKPAPDIFLAAARKLGVGPEYCIAVEDSPNGIHSASAAGMTTVMIPDLVEPDEELKKSVAYKLNTMARLPELLQQLKA